MESVTAASFVEENLKTIFAYALSGLEARAAEGDFAEELVEGMALKEEMRTLRREIALLTKEYRECTVAYYFEELSCAVQSKELDIPEFNGPAAVCVKENAKTAQATVTENVAVMEKNRK